MKNIQYDDDALRPDDYLNTKIALPFATYTFYDTLRSVLKSGDIVTHEFSKSYKVFVENQNINSSNDTIRQERHTNNSIVDINGTSLILG